MPYVCPVCGFPGLDDPPRSSVTGAGSDEICPSCGFQFGYHDDDRRISYQEWRKKWIAEGMKWDKGSSTPPQGWDPAEQLKSIGEKS
jgi:hypothetical protein